MSWRGAPQQPGMAGRRPSMYRYLMDEVEEMQREIFRRRIEALEQLAVATAGGLVVSKLEGMKL